MGELIEITDTYAKIPAGIAGSPGATLLVSTGGDAPSELLGKYVFVHEKDHPAPKSQVGKVVAYRVAPRSNMVALPGCGEELAWPGVLVEHSCGEKGPFGWGFNEIRLATTREIIFSRIKALWRIMWKKA